MLYLVKNEWNDYKDHVKVRYNIGDVQIRRPDDKHILLTAILPNGYEETLLFDSAKIETAP